MSFFHVTFGAIVLCSCSSTFFPSVDLLFKLVVLSSSLDRLLKLGTLKLDSRLFLFNAHDMKEEDELPKIKRKPRLERLLLVGRTSSVVVGAVKMLAHSTVLIPVTLPYMIVIVLQAMI